jgi:hypothetical protein
MFRLSALDSIFSGNTAWYQSPGILTQINYQGADDKFVLCGPIDGGTSDCLHIENNDVRVNDGSKRLLVDDLAAFSLLPAMTLSIDTSTAPNYNLYFYGFGNPNCKFI